MAKKDGTVLEIKITMKQDEYSDDQLNTNVDRTYCDKSMTKAASVFMVAIVAALKEASQIMNKDNDDE